MREITRIYTFANMNVLTVGNVTLFNYDQSLAAAALSLTACEPL